MRKLLILLCSWGVMENVQAQDITKPVHLFSLENCVDYAQKNNVQVKNSLLAIDAQIQTNREIGAAAFPTIGTNAGVNDFIKIPTSLLPAQIFGGAAGTYIPVQFGTKYNANYGINFQQLLFDGQVFVALKARASSLEWQKKNAALTEEAIKTNIYKIYYQLVVGNSQLGSLEANIERFKKLLHDTREIYKNGFAEKLDVDKVMVQDRKSVV